MDGGGAVTALTSVPSAGELEAKKRKEKKEARSSQGVKCQSYDGMGLLLGSGPFAFLPFALDVLGSGSPYFLTPPPCHPWMFLLDPGKPSIDDNPSRSKLTAMQCYAMLQNSSIGKEGWLHDVCVGMCDVQPQASAQIRGG